MSWQIYNEYDEESLVLHSNAGLLRRARKAVDEVELINQTELELQFKVEECEVKLPLIGITKASCNCPALDCCKHILSSILWIQTHPDALNSGSSVEQKNDEIHQQDHELAPEKEYEKNHEVNTEDTLHNNNEKTTPSHSALEIVLSFDTARMIKQLGIANVRLAYEILQNWQQNDLCKIDIQTGKISFQTEFSTSPILLYPSAGFDGILSEINDKQKKAVHLACLAYLFTTHTPDQWHWPVDIAQIKTETSNELLSEDIQFIQEIQILCQQFIAQGLSHLSSESVMGLHILNMQARAQSLPRLASELRLLHGLMRTSTEHSVQVDEAQLYSQLSHIYAYLAALLNVKDPIKLKTLKGSVQREYQDLTLEHLIPLGCEWWSLDSGARGLTTCFWDVQQQQLLEVTQARANHLDQTFNQYTAANTGIWGSSLDYLLKHQIELTHAKAQTETILSASDETRFMQKGVLTDLNLTYFAEHHIGIGSWKDLEHLIKPHSSLEQLQNRYAFLRFEKIIAPELNELDQSFEFRVIDQENQALKLSIPITAEYRARISKLTKLIQQEKVIACLVRIDASTQNIELIPTSVMLETAKGLSIFSLDYDYVRNPKKSSLSELITGRIEKLLEQKKKWKDSSQQSILDLLITQTQSILEFYSNIGRSQLDPDDLQKLKHFAMQFEELGITMVTECFNFVLNHAQSAQINLAHDLLIWRHVLLQLQRLNSRIAIEGQVMS